MERDLLAWMRGSLVPNPGVLNRGKVPLFNAPGYEVRMRGYSWDMCETDGVPAKYFGGGGGGLGYPPR